MPIRYLDTSAAMKLVVDEDESEALVGELAGGDDQRLVSSWLLHTEMHGAASDTRTTSTSMRCAPRLTH